MTESAAGPRVLVVANRTASTPRLLDEVTRRAQEGASFTVLIPPEKAGHDGDDWTPEVARELLERAAHGDVGEAYPGGDAVDTIHKLIEERRFDELIVSTAPQHLARWVHHDLPHRLRHLKVPVVIIPPEPNVPIDEDVSAVVDHDWVAPILPGADGSGAH